MLALWAIREAAIRRHGSMFAFLCNAVLRFLQFVGGLTVLGMYCALIQQENNPFSSSTPPAEMMALIIGAVSALAAIMEGLPWVSGTLWIVDAPIFLGYVVVFGIYGQQLIGHPLENASNTETARRTLFQYAMWLDCANMLLWGLTLLYTFLRWNRRRKERRMFEAEV